MTFPDFSKLPLDTTLAKAPPLPPPLEGARGWGDCEQMLMSWSARLLPRMRRGAPRSHLATAPRFTPTPAPPPSRGRGRSILVCI